MFVWGVSQNASGGGPGVAGMMGNMPVPVDAAAFANGGGGGGMFNPYAPYAAFAQQQQAMMMQQVRNLSRLWVALIRCCPQVRCRLSPRDVCARRCLLVAAQRFASLCCARRRDQVAPFSPLGEAGLG